ncbi:MAG TPA: SCO family protein [Kofleriaceae bacterium]|nr:SCO family protein [Kofleriaceae bacterium]
MRYRVWFVLALLAGLAVACDRGASAGSRTLDVLGAVPDFSFRDQTGAPVRAADLAGRVVVANFIFTRCPTVCPATSLKMQRIGQRLAKMGDAVQLVSFSVDPEHDTPEVLAEFAARYQADPERWRFLTGPSDQVRAAVEGGFKIALERRGELADGTPDIVHGVHFVLVDPELRIRGYYDSDDAARLDQLVADATDLARRRPD